MSVNDGGPAFPQPLARDCFGNLVTPAESVSGMSLRDYFAAHETLAEWDHPEAVFSKSVAESLAGPMPEGGWSKNPLETMKWEAKWRAAVRYIRADAMLEAREKGVK